MHVHVFLNDCAECMLKVEVYSKGECWSNVYKNLKKPPLQWTILRFSDVIKTLSNLSKSLASIIGQLSENVKKFFFLLITLKWNPIFFVSHKK